MKLIPVKPQVIGAQSPRSLWKPSSGPSHQINGTNHAETIFGVAHRAVPIEGQFHQPFVHPVCQIDPLVGGIKRDGFGAHQQPHFTTTLSPLTDQNRDLPPRIKKEDALGFGFGHDEEVTIHHTAGTKVGPHPSRWWNKLLKGRVVRNQTEQLHPPFGSLQDPSLFGVDIKHHIIRIVELSARFPEFVGVFAVQPLRLTISGQSLQAMVAAIQDHRTVGKGDGDGLVQESGERAVDTDVGSRLGRPPLHLHHSIIAGVGDQEITFGGEVHVGGLFEVAKNQTLLRKSAQAIGMHENHAVVAGIGNRQRAVSGDGHTPRGTKAALAGPFGTQ